MHYADLVLSIVGSKFGVTPKFTPDFWC